jgi:hypothetical protein
VLIIADQVGEAEADHNLMTRGIPWSRLRSWSLRRTRLAMADRSATPPGSPGRGSPSSAAQQEDREEVSTGWPISRLARLAWSRPCWS